MIQKIRAQINKCRDAMVAIGDGTVWDGMDVGPRTRHFITEMKNLIAILPQTDNQLASAIQEQIRIMESQSKIHPFAYGQLQAFLKGLSIKYGSLAARRFFISHSSRDKTLIKEFVEKIIRLGVGIPAEDVFCTSIETMGIKNGDDMRSHIHKNIIGSDIALLMISRSYIQSSICLNEMGAVWSAPIPNVNVFVCPDCELPKSIGWLYEVKKADMLCDKHALDSFYENLTNTYGIEKKVAEWGIQRDAFLDASRNCSEKTVLGKMRRKCKVWLGKGEHG